MLAYTLVLPFFGLPVCAATSLASSLNLTTGETLAFPTNVLASGNTSADYIKEEWDLYRNRIQFGTSDLAFVDDPTNSTDIVLSVSYPAGSYSKATGGTQFYAQPLNDSSVSAPQSALLSYSIYLPTNFSFVEGGKLPGFRGGSNNTGCSGGSETDGTGCFSTRIMWRAGGLGEVYAYIPVTKTLCSGSNVICNSDYGTSLGRGSFTFQRGAWNNISLFVQLNDPAKANGVVQLYYNGVEAISFDNVVLRTKSTIASIGGIFFSTFFGGDTSDYATPTNQSIYWKDIEMWGSAEESQADGSSYSLASDAQKLGTGAALSLAIIAFFFAFLNV